MGARTRLRIVRPSALALSMLLALTGCGLSAIEDAREEARAVESVLEEILDPHARAPILNVWNKMDLCAPDASAHPGTPAGIAISAKTGAGLEDLRTIMAQQLSKGRALREILLPMMQRGGLAWLYRHGDVRDRQPRSGGLALVCLS